MLSILKGIFLLPAFSAQTQMPVLRFEAVACVYSVADKELRTSTQELITIAIDDDFGRFVQIQFGDEALPVQYQILFENDPKVPGAVNILQNLLVGNVESSAESSGFAPSYSRIAQGTHSVRCEFLMKDSKLELVGSK